MPNILNRRDAIILGSNALAALTFAKRSWAQDVSVIRVRIPDDPGRLDPMFSTGLEPEETILASCLPRLTTFIGDGSTNWDLYAAEMLEQVSETRFRFRLREGLLWSDGFGTLSTADVKYSFERIADPANSSPWIGSWEALDRVEIVDELTGEIILKRPYAPIFLVSLPAFAGNIVCKAAVEAEGGSFLNSLPAQCGPYRMVDWFPRQRVVLEKNPDWPLDTPVFDRVELVIQQDSLLGEIAFQAGEVDYTRLSAESSKRYSDSPPNGSSVHSHPSTAFYWLGMNVEHPLLSDLKVRQAIQHSIDRDEIIDAAYGGQHPKATGLIPPILLGHRDANLVPFDPVIPPFLTGCIRRTYAAIFSFWAGVMPPIPMFGRSLL